MKQEEIDTLWFKALDESVKQGELYTRYKFAELIAAAEREACARVCEAFGQTLEVDVGPNFAEAIRARGDA
jgi:hypothetical protein